MIIRQATIEDCEKIYEMLRHYKNASPLRAHQYMNEDTAKYAVKFIIEKHHGLILLSEQDSEITGMIMALYSLNIWDQTIKYMQELAYWVEPEHRGSTTGYRLLKKYKEIGNKLMELGTIQYYTISKMVNSPDLDYKKFGFDYLEETHVCQVV
jgi:N-acetylglutamate synthase-like GNAT family acetyltransferase